MMSEWNVNQYTLFEKQRTQPAFDLVKRISDCTPHSIVDIGCGPGNSTEILYHQFPDAKIIGIDSSQNMIDKARNRFSDIDFYTCDVLDLKGTYDLIFSNACLQWVPDHQTLIPFLMDHLSDHGVLAVQMPYNYEEPLYKIVNEVTSDSKWGFDKLQIEHNVTLDSRSYIEILSKCCTEFDIWETKYFHLLPNHQALIEWIRSTKIRPYLAKLDFEKGIAFEKEILDKAISAYPPTKNGDIIFGFKRLFFKAYK